MYLVVAYLNRVDGMLAIADDAAAALRLLHDTPASSSDWRIVLKVPKSDSGGNQDARIRIGV
jgi:hypothetical protein